MPFKAGLAIRRAARASGKGDIDKAAAALTAAIGAGVSDPRLALRRAMITGNYVGLNDERESRSDHAATALFLAMDAYRIGRIEQAGRLCESAVELSPLNVTAQALGALIEFTAGHGAEPLQKLKESLPHATLDVQALALAAVESSIISTNPADGGAPERETVLGGPIGWIIDRLDDAAVWVYWLLSHIINAAVNLTNARIRMACRHVIEGDRLEGLRKPEEAMNRFREALKIDPDNREALESLTAHLISTGAHDEARDPLDRLWGLVGDGEEPHPQYARWKADILFGKRRLADAAPLYESAAETGRLDYMPPYRLGLCRLREGDGAGAVTAFRRALERTNPGLLKERVERLGG